MILGINAKMLTSPNPAGPELFTLNLLKELIINATQHKIVLYTNKPLPKMVTDSLQLPRPNIRNKVIHTLGSWTQVSLAMELALHPPDVYLTTEHTVPWINPRKTPIVAMIHGLEYKTNKQLSKSSFRYLLHPFILRMCINLSTAIIVPSEFTKEQLLINKILSPDKTKKVHVIYEGISHEFRPRDNLTIQQIKDKYGIKGDYLFFVSTIQPRKNIPLLVKAFSEVVKQKEYSNLRLVLAGKMGWKYQESVEAPLKYGVQDNVVFLGYTPQDELPFLYSGASAYVNFSLEEGFSLTVAEAMACGIPCCVSDIPTHREITKNLAYMANPYDTAEMYKSIIAGLTNGKNEMTNQAMKHARKFSWQAVARDFLTILQKAAQV